MTRSILALMLLGASPVAQEKGEKTVILVHGAFADGSSWDKVIPLLKAKGLHVVAVQNPLTSLADDVAATKRAIDAQKGPIILVGHSWGGTVITEAGSSDKVAALVYVAAFAPDVGESSNDPGKAAPPPPGFSSVYPDPAGYLYLTSEGVAHDFASDLPAAQTEVMAVTQGPIFGKAFDEKVTNAAWKTKPSWYIVAENDRMIQPDVERAMAKKIDAKVTSLPTSHVPMLSRPKDVAAVIVAAAGKSMVWAQQRPAIADQIAKTYGLDSWDQIEAIRYTFNVDWPALKLKTSRAWVWEPKTDRVSYDGKDKDGNPVKVTYSRSQLASQSAVVKNEIDPAFNNDQYNLLFAFHVVWDTSATVQDAGKQKPPLGKGFAEKVELNYPSEGGYTPADAWTLYVGDDGRVRELEIHRVNAPPSVYLTTFANYKKAGPLLLALDHPGSGDGKPLRIRFTNVAVKLAGSSTWLDAQ
jgi:pimeloyl-ACP methyl ester carboxylesterase